MDTQTTFGIEPNTLDRFIRGATPAGNTKSALSDKALLGQFQASFVDSPIGWGNGFMFIYEDTPTRTGYSMTTATPATIKFLNDVRDNGHADRMVYPSTACPSTHEGRRIYVEFDGVWFDGRYISALFKRCRKSKNIWYRLIEMPEVTRAKDGKKYTVVPLSLAVYADGLLIGLIIQLDLNKREIETMLSQADVVLRYAHELPQPVQTVEPEQTATRSPLRKNRSAGRRAKLDKPAGKPAKLDIRPVAKTRSYRPVLIGAQPQPEKAGLPAFVIVTNAGLGCDKVTEVYAQ